ncbi:hypothetical protein BCV71DRAFT_236822 [Rhizopus microsporus]|uniref:Uncharacterized protein n=1 Tax=Rhizopus microsporus TaxID=58291 RepID=A0A1X0RWF2_RHIZD|nr:hypothetical protein BCV71DRAFT_236822 [Rhizopus microsporus]
MSNGLSQEEINGLRELRELPKRQQVQDDKDEPRSFPNETRLEMKKKLPLVSSRTNLDNMPGIPAKIKKYNVDVVQHINAISKGADRPRTAAQGATEIFSDIQQILENG